MWVQPLGLKGLPRLPPMRPVPHRARQPRGSSGSPLSRVRRRNDADGRAATVPPPRRCGFTRGRRVQTGSNTFLTLPRWAKTMQTVAAPLALSDISGTPEPHARADLALTLGLRWARLD